MMQLFKTGPGPSSSHTFGPMKAAERMKELYPAADHFTISLRGSLALTGKGHLTDQIIKKTLKPVDCTILFEPLKPTIHPNTMVITAEKDGTSLGEHTFQSIGGGTILMDDETEPASAPDVYPHNTMDEIHAYCKSHHLRYDQYVDEMEGKAIDTYMKKIFKDMERAVSQGLKKTGVLPGELKLERVANALYQSALSCDDPVDENALKLASYAFAASEQNASGGMVVTAPTMGASGVIPAVLYHLHHDLNYNPKTLIQGLKAAGLIGLLIQRNATISGAKGGCQAEVGAACSMAAALVAHVQMQSNSQVETAAEIGLEHHLGLTCDPVGGYVMIPCIERNAVAAQRAIDAARLARYIRNVKKNRVSFDMVVETMNKTGQKLPMELKESALGGLAVVVPFPDETAPSQ